MDIMKVFEEWLPSWAEKNSQPIPTLDTPNAWSVAWREFQQTELENRHDELVEYYSSMRYKTAGDLRLEKRRKELEEEQQRQQEETVMESEPIIEKEESQWEKVKRMLNQ